MISPQAPIESCDVARHYDELDELYRDTWGEHLHHGFWDSPDDHSSIEDATIRLLQEVTKPLTLSPGQVIADIGCGYGTSARWVAERHEVKVLGLTISERQVTAAKNLHKPPHGQMEIVQEDWLRNSIADQSLDAAYSIEALAHMDDKEEFFHQLCRTLKPGAPVTISCWFAPEDPNPVERALLRAICREGKLPHLGSMSEYLSLAKKRGLSVLETRDLTHAVERTWTLISYNVLKGFFTNTRYLRFLSQRLLRKRIFVFTLPRLLLAYRVGAIRYGFLHLQAPRDKKERR